MQPGNERLFMGVGGTGFSFPTSSIFKHAIEAEDCIKGDCNSQGAERAEILRACSTD